MPTPTSASPLIPIPDSTLTPMHDESLQSSIPLIFITGFLGSGKTTLIASLLALGKGKRIGLLVNEWGSISIDGALLSAGVGKGSGDSSGVSLVEVNGGQIFCSCVSGSFVEGVAQLAARKPDFLIVETSGLARPGPMDSVVRAAILASGGSTRYGATVCVVDAVRFGRLALTSVAAREQAARADVLVLAKTDIASPAQISSACEALEELRPGQKVLPVVAGAVPPTFLEELRVVRLTSAPRAGAGIVVPGWGPAGRPVSLLLDPHSPDPEGKYSVPTESELYAFLTAVAALALRSKGIFEVASSDPGEVPAGPVGEAPSPDAHFPPGTASPVPSCHAVPVRMLLAETAGESVSLRPCLGPATGFVVITFRDAEPEIRRLWSRLFPS